MANGIEGLDKLMKKYGQLAEQVAGETMERAVKASCVMVQGEAKLIFDTRAGKRRILSRIGLRRDNGSHCDTVG